MPRRAPLTAIELAEIWDREPTETVKTLLWEIARLRATIMRAQQIREMCRQAPADIPGALWQVFGMELDREPCLNEEKSPRQKAQLDAALVRLRNGR